MNTVILALLSSGVFAVAEFLPSIPPSDIYVKHELTNPNSSRLSYDENGLAYLNVRTKRKTAEGYEDNVRKVLFTGVAVTEGDNWRADVTYKDGILDGRVLVSVKEGEFWRLLHEFRYEKGKKILPETSGTK